MTFGDHIPPEVVDTTTDTTTEHEQTLAPTPSVEDNIPVVLGHPTVETPTHDSDEDGDDEADDDSDDEADGDEDDNEDDEDDEDDGVNNRINPSPVIGTDPRDTDPLLARSRAAELERVRYATPEPFRFSQSVRERYILGCSMLLVTSITFIVLVSGITTMLAGRNFPRLEIFSSWKNGGVIPLKYGCHASGGPQNAISFPLRWRNVPRSATNLVILFAMIESASSDPVHWLVTDIPLNNDEVNGEGLDGFLPENASKDKQRLPEGALQLANSFSKNGSYWPPCTPKGTNDTSHFLVLAYAIDAHASIDSFRDAREVMNRFVGVPFAKLSGVYGNKFYSSDPKPMVAVNGKDGQGDGEEKTE